MTVETPTSRTMIRWLWQNYIRQHKWMLAVALLMMTIEGSMLGALSYMMQPMFDQVFIEGDRGALVWVGGVIFAIFAVRALSGVVQKWVMAIVMQRSAAEMRSDLLERLMRQDGGFHQTHPPGFLIQRVLADVGAVVNVWQALAMGAGRDAIALVLLLGVAISVDPVWALVACIGTPLLVLPATLVQRFVRHRAREARDLAAALSTRLDEVFHGIVPVKLNALEAYQARRYRDLTRSYVRAETRSAFGAALIPGMIDVMAGLGFLGVLYYGGSEIISGDKTVGQFMAFFTAMGFAFDPLRRLGGLSALWQAGAAAVERVHELMMAPIALKSPETPVAAPEGTPSVTFDNVALSYGETEVLRGLSFTAEAGKTTALVGASGAGKSTVFNILTRLVDPDRGTVRVGGVATTDMDLGKLRALFSVVTQEAVLFDDSIRENILLGRTDVDAAQLRGVLDAAHVSDFTDKLPQGLDTPVGPRGSALSGGQRQRVVIARALLRNTPLLLLDEATSALDAQSEKKVQQALDRLAKGRTTLVIAHRLATIRDADKIVVMDRGAAVDEGQHDGLLERGGLYADLCRLQFQDGKTVVDISGTRAVADRPDVGGNVQSGLLSKIASLFR